MTTTPRRKKQPTAALMREQLALAAEEIIRLRDQVAIKPALALVFWVGAAFGASAAGLGWWLA